MASASIFSAIGSFYKRVYAGGAPGDIAMRDKPLFSALAKQAGFEGYDSSGTFRYAIGYGNAQGLAGTFSTAQTNAASSKAVQLGAARVPLYGVVTIGGEELAAADTRNGSFWDTRKRETDMMLDALGEEIEFQLFRNGSGVRGRRASINSNTVTLTVAADAKNFRIGMTVAASDQADGSSPRTGTTTVTAVDEDAGTVTLASAAAISAFANNDYLYRAGSLGSSYNMQGLAAHLPLTAPTAGDNFRGIDRSVDVRRLAGVRVNDTSTSLEENIGNAAVKIMEVGKKADVVFMSPTNMWNMLKRRQSQVQYPGAGGKSTYGFGEAFIETPAGVIAAKSSPLCPEDRTYVLTSKTWYIKTLRELPHIINDDGNAALRQTSDDGIEVRARGWGNLICTEPGANAVVAV